VRAAGADVVLVAPGISCRQQIEHLTGRQAKHPAEALWDSLRPG
jgi:Fe-S oxidoreductase